MLEECDVDALHHLSSSLKTDLRFGIFKEQLVLHPLFRLWADVGPGVVRDLCGDEETMSYTWLEPGDDLFVAGTYSSRAFLLAKGALSYQLDREFSFYAGQRKGVPQGSWLCEAALW